MARTARCRRQARPTPPRLHHTPLGLAPPDARVPPRPKPGFRSACAPARRSPLSLRPATLGFAGQGVAAPALLIPPRLARRRNTRSQLARAPPESPADENALLDAPPVPTGWKHAWRGRFGRLELQTSPDRMRRYSHRSRSPQRPSRQMARTWRPMALAGLDHRGHDAGGDEGRTEGHGRLERDAPADDQCQHDRGEGDGAHEETDE